MIKNRIFLALCLLALASPANAVIIRVKWTEPASSGWASLGVLVDGTLVRGDLLTTGVDCGAPAKCVDLPPPTTRGVTVQYSLRACNSWNECAASNTVPLQVPTLPVSPSLSITVIP